MNTFCSINGTKICCSGYRLNNEQNNCIRKQIYLIIIDKTYIPCSYFITIFYRLNKKLQFFNVFAACLKGYNGILCEEPCVFPYYGFDCQSQCKCAEVYCHYADGCNQTSEIGILINLLFMPFTLCIIFVDFYLINKILLEILLFQIFHFILFR